jgi:MoxR-like ATPase
VAKVIVGQHQMVDLMIAGLLSNGHILIEGVPGVAKTLTAKLLARCLDIPFSRIQFTPDLMPSDVLGTSVFDPRSSAFEFRPGPIFSSMVLIDEINRSPAKTQSSLFEVMEERQVTIDGKTHPMQAPFMVVATQNPVEHEGTYRLPEAQLDRFLFKINVPYPNLEEEVNILRLNDKTLQTDQLGQVQKLLSGSDIVSLQSQIRSIHVEEKLVRFIAALVQETRNSKSVFLGASPRASLAIMMAAKAIAGMAGRDFVTPDDIVFVVPAVLRHRLLLTPEKEMEGITTDEVIQGFIKSIEIPR